MENIDDIVKGLQGIPSPHTRHVSSLEARAEAIQHRDAQLVLQKAALDAKAVAYKSRVEAYLKMYPKGVPEAVRVPMTQESEVLKAEGVVLKEEHQALMRELTAIRAELAESATPADDRVSAAELRALSEKAPKPSRPITPPPRLADPKRSREQLGSSPPTLALKRQRSGTRSAVATDSEVVQAAVTSTTKDKQPAGLPAGARLSVVPCDACVVAKRTCYMMGLPKRCKPCAIAHAGCSFVAGEFVFYAYLTVT
jgi:hypothetical protein